MIHSRKDILLAQMAACHDEENWFVPLHAALEGLTPETAAQHEAGSIGSVWQIVNHLTFWNERYLQRFKGLPLPEGELNNDATFTFAGDAGGDEDWKSAVARLHDVMSEWRRVIAECDEAKLDSPVRPESDDPWCAAIAHLSIHTAYHIGQIVQIRKQQGTWTPRVWQI